MPLARFEKLEPEKQEALLAAAAEEFAAHGYEAASLNRILERAGSSKGALYYYFADKADLFATVVERSLERVLKDVGWSGPDELGAENYWDSLRELRRRSMKQIDSDAWYMRIGRSFYRLREEPAARKAMGPVLDHGRERLRLLLERGQELGVVRRDLPLALLVEIAVATDEAGKRWTLQHWRGLREDEKGALLDAQTDLIRDMLSAKSTG